MQCSPRARHSRCISTVDTPQACMPSQQDTTPFVLRVMVHSCNPCACCTTVNKWNRSRPNRPGESTRTASCGRTAEISVHVLAAQRHRSTHSQRIEASHSQRTIYKSRERAMSCRDTKAESVRTAAPQARHPCWYKYLADWLDCCNLLPVPKASSLLHAVCPLVLKPPQAHKSKYSTLSPQAPGPSRPNHTKAQQHPAHASMHRPSHTHTGQPHPASGTNTTHAGHVYDTATSTQSDTRGTVAADSPKPHTLAAGQTQQTQLTPVLAQHWPRTARPQDHPQRVAALTRAWMQAKTTTHARALTAGLTRHLFGTFGCSTQPVERTQEHNGTPIA